MRGILVVLLFALALPFALRRPLVGLLLYFWISIMNPHRYTWGFTETLPLAQIAALVTLVSCLFNFKELKFPRLREIYPFFLFWLFITITTMYSLYPDLAWEKWKIVSKIFLMTFITMLVVTTREKLLYFIVAIMAYIGLIGVKGTIFGIRTAGQYKVWGPPGSFLADNNDIGLALVMIIPLCFFVKNLLAKKIYSHGVFFMGVASGISAVLTFSRGALLGLATIGLFYFLQAKNKLAVFIALVSAVVISLSFLPSSWFERMNTISTFKSDASANQRLDSWTFSYRLARAHALGGGFECFTPEQYFLYSPNPTINVSGEDAHTAHSIYFQVLAEHGFGGLIIFLGCLLSTIFTLRKLNRFSRYLPDGDWIAVYSRAFTVSLTGFMACGAFLSRAYFDLFWIIYAAAACLKAIVFSDNWIEEPAAVMAQPVKVFNPA